MKVDPVHVKACEVPLYHDIIGDQYASTSLLSIQIPVIILECIVG